MPTIAPKAYASQSGAGYHHRSGELATAHRYLMPAVRAELALLRRHDCGSARLFDLGCGNGSVAALLAQDGWKIWGVDPSLTALSHAGRHHHLSLVRGSAYDDLADRFGRFPVVISLEVVEHLYDPRTFARTLFELVEPGGTTIVSTPFHGYWKNLALALSGRMDDHFTALWDHGHIKFFSQATLGALLKEAGFSAIRFRRVGRVPLLAKSMIAIAHKAI